MNNNTLEHEFLDYSLKIYNEASVKDACLFLQNNFKLNVNFLLFCCWFAQGGQGRLTRSEFNLLLEKTSRWHEDITCRLRQVRHFLKQNVNIKNLYQAFCDTELLAEKIEQSLILSYMPYHLIKRRSSQQRAQDGAANLHIYYSITKTILNPEGYLATKTLLRHAFPQFALHHLEQLSLPL